MQLCEPKEAQLSWKSLLMDEHCRAVPSWLRACLQWLSGVGGLTHTALWLGRAGLHLGLSLAKGLRGSGKMKDGAMFGVRRWLEGDTSFQQNVHSGKQTQLGGPQGSVLFPSFSSQRRN